MLLARAQPHQLAEFSNVPEQDLRPCVFETDAQMGVGVGPKAPLRFGGQCGARRARHQPWTGRGFRKELPGHPEMYDEAAAVIELRNQVLAAARERPDGPPGERPAQLGRRGDEEVAGLGGVDLADAPADQQRLDLPPRHLDLGKLGHWNSSADWGELPQLTSSSARRAHQPCRRPTHLADQRSARLELPTGDHFSGLGGRTMEGWRGNGDPGRCMGVNRERICASSELDLLAEARSHDVHRLLPGRRRSVARARIRRSAT